MLTKLYPEINAGGYSRDDGTVEFYARVNALLRPSMRVLDFGAGRGQGPATDPVPYRRELRRLQDKVDQIVGIDVDDAVLGNPFLDEAHLVEPGDPLPLETCSVDMILADWVFEHIKDGSAVAAEFARVLKPGGWVCARTPNRWGHLAVASRMVPNRLHHQVLSVVQKHRQREDIFATYYRLNTARAIRRAFGRDSFECFVYSIDGEPAYFGEAVWANRLAAGALRLSPNFFRTFLLVFMRRT